jgi:hypothetical protein
MPIGADAEPRAQMPRASALSSVRWPRVFTDSTGLRQLAETRRRVRDPDAVGGVDGLKLPGRARVRTQLSTSFNRPAVGRSSSRRLF